MMPLPQDMNDLPEAVEAAMVKGGGSLTALTYY